MKKTGLAELEQFTLTRSEYAKRIGKTPNAVRMMMRHGKLTGQYRFDGNKFLFISPDRPRDNQVKDHPNLTTLKPKKTYNRGNHFKAVEEGKYPNEAFKLYNERKKEMAILNKIQGKFKSKSHEAEFNKINETALKQARNNEMKRAEQRSTPGVYKDYGSMLTHRGLEIQRENDYRRLSYRSELMENVRSGSGSVFFGSRRNPYEPGIPEQDGVEIDVSRVPDNTNLGMPRFSSKIDEEIWKLKNKK